ncbi:MAG: polyprenyl synthetase family protein [Gemmatimonadetes bacterium]|nr:polyprenyl synthetase family protein [Gemmatimonadota bacterium]
MDAPELLTRARPRVEEALRRVAATVRTELPPALAEPMVYSLEGDGKRLRPLLCLAAFHACGGPADAPGSCDIACATELIHTYSLVHDDLPCMDNDDLRRGRATTHRVFGEARAALAGAALIPLACRTVERGAAELGLSASERAALIGELCRAAGAGGMIGGQLLDLQAEGRSVELPALEAIHRRKTGALLVASLRLGALAARAGRVALAAITEYGRAVGLAFQIADDVLDASGQTEVLGKMAGRDRELAKSTFPAVLGLEVARSRARAEAEAAVQALERAGIDTPELVALARFAAERER